MSVSHNYFILSKINDTVKLSINQFSLLKHFHATCFGPLQQSSGNYKQQNISMFIIDMRDAFDPLLIAFSYKSFYMRLRSLKILKYPSNISKTCLKLLSFLSFAKENCLVMHRVFFGGFLWGRECSLRVCC
jgi:hypothetical protein